MAWTSRSRTSLMSASSIRPPAVVELPPPPKASRITWTLMSPRERADICTAVPDRDSTKDFRRALQLFDARQADAVMLAGDITDHGLLSQMKEAAAAWFEVFPDDFRSYGS